MLVFVAIQMIITPRKPALLIQCEDAGYAQD